MDDSQWISLDKALPGIGETIEVKCYRLGYGQVFGKATFIFRNGTFTFIVNNSDTARNLVIQAWRPLQLQPKGKNFSQALADMKNGKNVQRSTWGKEVYIRIEDDHDDYEDWIELNHNEDLMHWSPNHQDLLAEDWEIA